MKSEPRTNRSASSDKPLGVKEDNSVLFSLDSLKAQAEEAASPKSVPSGVAKFDDSGLIDLNALEASAQRTDTASAAAIHVPIFPFGAPEVLPTAPPTTAPVVESIEPVDFKGGNKKARLFAALSLGAVVIAGVAFMATRDTTPLSTLSAKLSPAFEEPTKRAASAAKIVAVAEAPKKADAVESAKEAPPIAGKRPAQSATQRQPGADKKPADPPPVVETKPKPPPVADNCDLMCQMARAAGRKGN